MYDENYIMVQVWSDILGSWQDVDEAKDADDARRMIESFQPSEDTFSIVYHQRTIIRPTK